MAGGYQLEPQEPPRALLDGMAGINSALYLTHVTGQIVTLSRIAHRPNLYKVDEIAQTGELECLGKATINGTIGRPVLRSWSAQKMLVWPLQRIV